MTQNVEKLLEFAREEIVALRRANEIHASNDSELDFLSLVFHTSQQKSHIGFGDNLLWKLEAALSDLKDQREGIEAVMTDKRSGALSEKQPE